MASPARNAMIATPTTAKFYPSPSAARLATDRRDDYEATLDRLAFAVAGGVGGTDREDVVAELQVFEVERGRAGLPLGLVGFADEGRAGRIIGDVLETEHRLALAGLDAGAHGDAGA